MPSRGRTQGLLTNLCCLSALGKSQGSLGDTWGVESTHSEARNRKRRQSPAQCLPWTSQEMVPPQHRAGGTTLRGKCSGNEHTYDCKGPRFHVQVTKSHSPAQTHAHHPQSLPIQIGSNNYNTGMRSVLPWPGLCAFPCVLGRLR